MSIKNNVKTIQSEIKKITSELVRLVAITKNRSLEEIKELIEAGITDIGENRLKEAKEKIPHLPKNITKHFIGRLQTNKVREVVQLFDVIQSVDSLKLAKKIDQECAKIARPTGSSGRGKKMPVLIQINTSDESQKGGVSPDEAFDLIKETAKLHNIQVQGLMTIALHSDDENKVRECFVKLKLLFDKINAKSVDTIGLFSRRSHFGEVGRNAKLECLSMGMSEDYLIAIKEGSNMVRIGRKIFD